MNPEIPHVTAITAAPSWQPELFDRESELAELDSMMRAACEGTGGSVLVEAPAGMGKTRLLERLRARAARAGMRVLSARATELEREFPYGVVRQLFDSLVASVPELLEGSAAGARPALGVRGGAQTAPAEISFATLYGLYWLTVNASDEEPAVLVVDDAHWADAPTLQFLLFLAARLEGLPILVAAAARPGDEHVTRFGADPSVRRVTPAALSRESTAALLSAALDVPADKAFADACHELTGGNPFLLVELTRTLSGEGVTPTAEHVAVVRGLVPDTIARAVLLRLAPLPDAARELARAVAILGDGCEPARAAALAGLGPSVAAQAADAMRAAHILDAGSELRFLHPLIGNAVHADIPAGARSRAHAQAAALLAEEGMPVERIAIHLLMTGPAGDAAVAETLCAAARAALDKGAPQPAISYVRRALREPPVPELREEALALLIAAGERAADPASLEEYVPEVMEAFEIRPDRLLRFGDAVAKWMIGAGRFGEAMALLERTIAAAECAGDLRLAVSLETELISFRQMPPAEAIKRFSRFEGRLADDSPEERLALALRSWWSSIVGDPAAESAELARRALKGGRIFAEQSDSLGPAQAILALARADELDAAAEAIGHQVAEAEARGAVTTLAGAGFLRGYVAFRRGDVRSAEADARQAVDTARTRGFLAVAPIFLALLVDTLVERGELDAADEELAASGMWGEVPDSYWYGPVVFSRGKLRLAQGRAREAADELLELRERAVRWGTRGNAGAPAGAIAARALTALGEQARAVGLAQEELTAARRWGASSAVGEALAALGVATGGDEGITLLREAVEALERAPTRLLHAATLVDLGAALRRERQPTAAREPLRAGLDMARRCGALSLARRAAYELSAAGEKVPRYTPIGAEALTPSERRVAGMAAAGMSNREIAAALYVTIKTVESHLRAAYDKLGIASRRELGDALES